MKIMSNLSVEKNELLRVLILSSIALVIGTYLILTCTLISKDGVYYIERAKLFSDSPIELIKGEPCGYLFLIFIAHKFAMLFINSSSSYTWIYSAQIITLICRLAALIPSLFLFLVRILGIFMLVSGILDLLNGMFAVWTYQTHKGFILIGAVVSLCTIPVWTILLLNPQIMPLVFWSQQTGFYVHGIRPDMYWIFYLVVVLIIIGRPAGDFI